jgi:hypothetical protein
MSPLVGQVVVALGPLGVGSALAGSYMASAESAKASIWWGRHRMDAPGAKSNAILAIQASRGGER